MGGLTVFYFIFLDLCSFIVQFVGKLRNICGLVWWVVFLQTVLEWANFSLNVEIFSYINIDFLYIYFTHFIGYSSGLKYS